MLLMPLFCPSEASTWSLELNVTPLTMMISLTRSLIKKKNKRNDFFFLQSGSLIGHVFLCNKLPMINVSTLLNFIFRSSEPTGSGQSFRPGTWQPPTWMMITFLKGLTNTNSNGVSHNTLIFMPIPMTLFNSLHCHVTLHCVAELLSWHTSQSHSLIT